MYKYHLDFLHIEEPVCYKDTLLFQLGRLYCFPGTVIEKHAHLDWFELTVISDGSGTVKTNGVATPVQKGDIYLSYPGDFHEIISSGENPLKYDFFAFATKNALLEQELKNIMNSHTCEERVFRSNTVNYAVSDAISELSAKKKYSSELLSLIFEEIIFNVIRSFDFEMSGNTGGNLSPNELCFQIMHHIDTHIYSIKKLASLSEKFSYNYSYLSNFFKKKTGTTIAEYYQNRRLETAKLLINSGDLKITNIAERLNYSSLFAFSKAFKKKYGIAPKNYIGGGRT